MCDVDLGKTFEIVEVELDRVVAQFQRSGLTDESIGDTVIEFKSGSKPDPEGTEWADASPRHVTIWLGACAARVLKFRGDEQAVALSALVSGSLAHEGEHLR